MRHIAIGGAQLGAIQKAESRQQVVSRMLTLMDKAKASGVELIVYPELTLTTFFPRYYMEDQAEVDLWFERAMPNEATAPLLERAAAHGMAMSFGYAELTPDGRHFNSSILTDKTGRIIGKYRKVHLPGHEAFEPDHAFQHLEKRYFEPGNLGFPVWRSQNAVIGMCTCNDRRWPETYRVMGLQGVELVLLGYNTPTVNPQMPSESLADRLFHSDLSMQAGAYQNSCWVVGVAKAGDEDGHPLMAGSIIVDPNGKVVARATTDGDELIIHDCDLDLGNFGKATIFDVARHRRIEHYGRITAQTGSTPPPSEG